MAQHTVTLTAAQELALGWFVNRHNQDLPEDPWTADGYLQSLVTHWISARLAELVAAQREAREEKYDALTPAQKAQVDAILG